MFALFKRSRGRLVNKIPNKSFIAHKNLSGILTSSNRVSTSFWSTTDGQTRTFSGLRIHQWPATTDIIVHDPKFWKISGFLSQLPNLLTTTVYSFECHMRNISSKLSQMWSKQTQDSLINAIKIQLMVQVMALIMTNGQKNSHSLNGYSWTESLKSGGHYQKWPKCIFGLVW